MTATLAQFRQNHPEFKSPIVYPDPDVQRYLALGIARCNPARWCDLADLGAELFTAHMLVLDERERRRANAGGTPGQVTGPMGSKSLGSASASYDTASVTEEDGGFWNSTSYGARFLRFARMAGAGPIHVI